MMISDDEESSAYTWRGVPGTIVLINVFDTEKKETSNIAHAATCRLVRQHLRASSSRYVAVCLYGTDDTKDATSAFGGKSVVDVLPLAIPSLDDYKKLRKIQLSSYEPAKEFKLSDALWQCSKIFTNCKKQLSSKTIILLTRMDKAPVPADQKPSLKRVVDLVDSNIYIKIVNIANDEYTPDQFYEKFLIEANKGIEDFELPRPVWDIRFIETLMDQESHRHLAVARINFEVGEGFSFGVGVYNLLKRSTYQRKIDLDRESNAILTSVSKTMKVSTEQDSDTPSNPEEHISQQRQVPLLKSEILHYQVYGDDKIQFTDYEMKKLKNPFGPPKMKLLGFKPSSLLKKEKWFLKPGYFLFPNENLVEGSTLTFKAMHKACAETGMVAICVLTTRVNSNPDIVALSPCSRPLGLDVEIGFDVIHLPFMENVRDISQVDDEGDSTISEEQKILMQDILTQLKFDYTPDMFQNPKIQSEYRAIEAIALDEDDLDDFVDTTRPTPEKFNGLQEDLFEQLFGPIEQTVTKRRTTNTETATAAKRLKGEEINDSVVQDMIKSKTVDRFTVGQLKDILKNCGNTGLPALSGLKKNELVDLVYQHCRN